MAKEVQIGKFKAECLHLLDEVNKTKISIVITKHDVPIVKIVPANKEKKAVFGCMKGTAKTLGDIIEPLQWPFKLH
jgi:prevent-host-death family protein